MGIPLRGLRSGFAEMTASLIAVASLTMTSRRSLVILSETKNLSNNLAVWLANPRGWMEHQSQRGDPSTPLRMTRINVLSTIQLRVERDPILTMTDAKKAAARYGQQLSKS